MKEYHSDILQFKLGHVRHMTRVGQSRVSIRM